MLESLLKHVRQFGSNCYKRLYIPLHFILIPFTFLFGSFGKQMRNRLFTIFFENVGPTVRPLLHPLKTDLFADLKLQKKVRQPFRILEVGAGIGSNLQFFPDGTELLIVEPNDSFIAPLTENVQKYPGIRLIQNFVCHGENMHEVPSGSVDAVVTTSVHCSVTDTHKVLKEIHRVLVPGGKYYFSEHCLYASPFLRLIQTFLTSTNIWGMYFCGCQFRDIPKEFINSEVFQGRINGQVKCIDRNWWNPIITLVAPHYVGTATKEN